MDFKTILYSIIGASLFIFFMLLLILQWMKRRRERDGTAMIYEHVRSLLDPNSKKWRERLSGFYQRGYILAFRTPVFKHYLNKIRRRIAGIHSYDEYTVRKETMKIALFTIATVGLTGLILLFVNQDLTSFVMVLLGVIILNNLMVDALVNRVENRLLKQLAHLLADVRHYYHAHGMVEEAISDASEHAAHEAGLHGKTIVDILTANNPEEAIEHYYEVAPNRFLKGFAGVSYLIREYGDKVLQTGSMYLNALTKLTNEIHIELLRRERLNYLLKSLTVVAVAPILFTEPIEAWARNNFPAVSDFYDSKLGVICKIIVYIMIIAAYTLLRHIQANDEGKYAAKVNKQSWEANIYRLPILRTIIHRCTPAETSKEHYKLSQLLKDANSSLPMESITIHRILFSLAGFAITFAICVYLHALGTHHIMHAPTRSVMMFGQLSAEEKMRADELATFDRSIILKAGKVDEPAREHISMIVSQSSMKFKTQEEQNETIRRIWIKLIALQNEYIKWWEVVLSFVIGWLAYYIPFVLLLFQKHLRTMDMKNEVDQFHTLIAILCEMSRISVENILEWMERFAAIFKEPLQHCLLHYEAGAEQALDILKSEAPFVPFVRTVEKLQLAAEKIPIKQAFDDLESEQKFYQEQRKQDYERIIETKAGWGRMIGFAPLYTVVFLYLVFPLVYMSMKQMGVYYEQIQRIH